MPLNPFRHKGKGQGKEGSPPAYIRIEDMIERHKILPALQGFRRYLIRESLANIAKNEGVTLNTVKGWHKKYRWRARRDTIRQRIMEDEIDALQSVISEAKPEFIRRTVNIINSLQIKAEMNLSSKDRGDQIAGAKLATTAHDMGKDLYGGGGGNDTRKRVDISTLNLLEE